MTPTISVESILPELKNIIAEYIFPKLYLGRSPLFRLGICLRSCNTTYRNTFTRIIKSEIKNNNMMINVRGRKSEDGLYLIFGAENGIFNNIEHADLTRVKFASNLLRVLPSTLKTLHLEKMNFVSLDEVHHISHLVNLTSLGVDGCSIGDGTFLRALAALPSIENLADLRLRNDPFAGDVVAELVMIERFSKLSVLDLSNNHIRCEHIQQLAPSPYMGRLTSLNLSSNSIGNESMTLIANSPYFGNLTQLILDFNRGIGDEGIIELTRSSYLRQLTKLGVIDSNITALGFIRILESEPFNRLTTLDVSRISLSTAPLSALPQRLFISSITSLDLSEGFIDNIILPVVMGTSLLMNLRTLDLSGGNYTNASAGCSDPILSVVEAIARSPYVRNITNLNLSMCAVDERWLKVLADTSNFSKLTALNLSSNHIGDEGVYFLLQSRNLGSLIYLYMFDNFVKIGGALALASSEFLGRLMYLDLSSNKIDVVGLQALLQSKLLNGYKDLKMDIKHQRTSDDDCG